MFQLLTCLCHASLSLQLHVPANLRLDLKTSVPVVARTPSQTLPVTSQVWCSLESKMPKMPKMQKAKPTTGTAARGASGGPRPTQGPCHTFCRPIAVVATGWQRVMTSPVDGSSMLEPSTKASPPHHQLRLAQPQTTTSHWVEMAWKEMFLVLVQSSAGSRGPTQKTWISIWKEYSKVNSALLPLWLRQSRKLILMPNLKLLAWWVPTPLLRRTRILSTILL